MSSVPARADTAPPIMCVAAAAYCGALGLVEREAAGRLLICCRHYLGDDSIVAIYDALYDEGADW